MLRLMLWKNDSVHCDSVFIHTGMMDGFMREYKLHASPLNSSGCMNLSFAKATEDDMVSLKYVEV